MKTTIEQQKILAVLKEYFPDAAEIAPEKLKEVTNKIIDSLNQTKI